MKFRNVLWSVTSTIAACSSLTLASVSPVQALPLLFDFEEISTGTYTTLPLTRAGYNVTVSRTSGTSFEISNISPFSPPAGWGQRTLSPFNSFFTNDGFLFDISAPVSYVSIETADYFADYDTVSLTAYDSPGGAGTVLDSLTVDWGTQGPPAVAVLTTTSPLIWSVVARGGNTQYPASMYWDNLTINPSIASVPAPIPVFGAAVAFGYSRKIRLRCKVFKA